MNIIKYENRRLYSASDSRYVTYKEIVAYVKAGGQITALCAITRNDITTDILKKCISHKSNLQSNDLYKLLRQ